MAAGGRGGHRNRVVTVTGKAGKKNYLLRVGGRRSAPEQQDKAPVPGGRRRQGWAPEPGGHRRGSKKILPFACWGEEEEERCPSSAVRCRLVRWVYGHLRHCRSVRWVFSHLHHLAVHSGALQEVEDRLHLHHPWPELQHLCRLRPTPERKDPAKGLDFALDLEWWTPRLLYSQDRPTAPR